MENRERIKERSIFGSFFLNESEFALSVTHIQEVVNSPEKFTTMPLAPSYMKGLLNLRGSIVPVIDLKSILRLSDSILDSTQKVAIVEMGGYTVGLLLDRTGEIFKSQEDERSDFEDTSDCSVISGVFKKEQGKRIVQILNVSGLFKLQSIPRQNEITQMSLKNDVARRRGQRKQSISFVVGPSRCALGIDEIQEIIKPDKVNESSLAMNHCIGTIDLRGATVPVIDFSAFLGYREIDRSSQAVLGDQRVVVMRIEAELFGLLVDSVDNIISYFSDEVVPFPVLSHERSEMFLGCIIQSDREDVILLDHSKIFMNSEISEMTHGHSVLYHTQNFKNASKKARSMTRKTYITFTIENMYAIEIGEVGEIIEYPKTLLQPPGLPEAFLGILNLRGALVTLVDARMLYASGSSQGACGKVLVFKKNGIHFGLVVDSVEGILTFSESEKVKLPEFLYRDTPGGLTEDIAEAVEVSIGEDKKRSLLILSAGSIAARVISRVSPVADSFSG